MKERRQAILEASIRHYIETGSPVTSQVLFIDYNFGIKPAMIRAELNLLGEEGYFIQNHPSGGRIPTDKAYRFFVEHILKNKDEFVAKGRLASVATKCANELLRGHNRFFIEEVARHLDLFGVGYQTIESRIYGSGMYTLFSQLDVNEHLDFLNIARDIELLESRIDAQEEWLLSNNIWPQVFIGENLLTKSHCLSVIANRFSINGSPFLFFMIGPTRMDYGKSLQFLNKLEQLIEEH